MWKCLVPAASVTALWGAPARACELALLLALDISGSVDSREYALQRDGLVLALGDAVVAEALISAEAQVAVMQWTGSNRQSITIPWTQITDAAALEAFRGRVAADKRVWEGFSTAVGEAMVLALESFATGPDCTRRVLDVSGDGESNEGVEPDVIRPAFEAEGITVNALVIEGPGAPLTPWFRSDVIVGLDAFALTANSYDDYPDRIRQKLIRETTLQLARLDEAGWQRPF